MLRLDLHILLCPEQILMRVHQMSQCPEIPNRTVSECDCVASRIHITLLLFNCLFIWLRWILVVALETFSLHCGIRLFSCHMQTLQLQHVGSGSLTRD